MQPIKLKEMLSGLTICCQKVSQTNLQRKSKGEKREKKEIWGKYNFLQYKIIKPN